MYEPSKSLGSFDIRGFQYWDGVLVLGDLKVGTKLSLVGEPENPHDPNAVAIYFGSSKLGFVPAEANDAVSTMLFFGHTDVFEARVLKVDPNADPWNQVRVGIYVTDKR